jgi:hypothetical protein
MNYLELAAAAAQRIGSAERPHLFFGDRLPLKKGASVMHPTGFSPKRF